MKNLPHIISAIKDSNELPIVSLVKENPEVSAVLSKLIKDSFTQNLDESGRKKLNVQNFSDFLKISNNIAQKNEDADSVLELFPEIELSAQILISSILSPKDMSDVELIYSIENGLKCSDISGILISEVKSYLNKHYRLEKLLPVILRRVLFETGSYPIAVIPEASIDDLINNTTGLESIYDNTDLSKRQISLGILGNPSPSSKSTSVSTESFNNVGNYKSQVEGLNGKVHVSDNYKLLRMAEALEQVKETALKQKLYGNVSTESVKRLNDGELHRLFYKNNPNKQTTIKRVKTTNQLNRKTIGEPVVLRLPSEAVIPVFSPGDEENHIAYFVLLDSEGNPINRSSNSSNYNDLQNRLNNLQSNTDMGSNMLRRAQSVFGANCNSLNIQQATQIYSEIIEADLLARLRNGIYGNDLAISKNEEIYKLMLARTLKQQFTQILFVPKELLTYFAHKYDNNGIGKSLLDVLRMLNSLRAMTLFSKVLASIKNSIGRTEVEVDLDEDDPNPNKTIETVVTELARSRQQAFPLGMSNAADIVDWVQRSGMQYKFNNHPGLPNFKMNVSESSSSHVIPDDSLEDDLRKRSIMAIGLSPETVDNGYAGEFATSVVNNNLLLSKRVNQIQEQFVPQIEEHIRIYIANNGSLIQKLEELVANNFDKVSTVFGDITITKENKPVAVSLLVQEFISNLIVSLPKPNNVSLENQISSFEVFEQALDKLLPFFISQQSLPGSLVGEELTQKVDEIKEVIKAYYCRKFMAENNILPDLMDLVTSDEEGKPVLNLEDIHRNHNSSIVKSIIGLFAQAAPIAKAADKDLQNLGTDQIPETDPPETGSDSTSTDSDIVDGDDSQPLNNEDNGDLGLPAID